MTDSERYLIRLCDRTFLTLWSYPGVYIDKGRVNGKGHGKELCDLLVIFDDHIIIFSDKDCSFPDTGNPQLDWNRWYRRAIENSAKEVWRAERWIKTLPDRLFLDRACTQSFPLDIPDLESAKMHRVVVAHGVAERCRREVGGSGTLRIAPDIVGAMHYTPPEEGGNPFAIGQIDPTKGFVHVVGDASLDIVMTELDTATDFVTYLTKKEELILAGHLESAAGEEDLLAHYLFPTEGKDESDFVMPSDGSRLAIKEGLWTEFDRDSYRLARREANAISYFWDGLIESSAEQVIANTQSFASHPGIHGGATAFRIPASESRTRRRLFSTAIRDVVMNTPYLPSFRRVRVMQPTNPGEPYYVFLLLSPPLHGLSHAEYRNFRRMFLVGLCDVVKLRYPDAEDIVGIATELGDDAGRSQDVVYRVPREFTDQEREEAQAFADAHRVFRNVVQSPITEYDYPDPGSRR